MSRKSRNTSRRTIGTSLFILLAGIVVALATGSSLSQSQQAPTLRIVSEDGNHLPVIVITGADIRNLPAGETRIIQKVEGGDTGGVQTQAGGGVWKTNNGGKTWDLVKAGTGTLALPPANNTAKEGKGTLVLTSTNNVVYEFRDLSAAEFDRVYVEENISLNFEEIKLFVQEHRPPGEMNGWPFKRLLITLAAGKAKGGTATGQVKTYTNPQGRYSCESGKFCNCTGLKDCQTLADAGSCASSINCDGEGSNLNCYCKAR